MLRTAASDERQTPPQPIDVPWPPAIKPPSLRALEMPRAAPGLPWTATQPPTPPAERADRRAARHVPTALAFWFGVYVAINISDLISTDLGLHLGLHEGNPLMRTMLAQYGFAALIVYKLVVIVAVVFGLSLLTRRHPRLAAATLAICNVLVGLAVVLNVVQFAML